MYQIPSIRVKLTKDTFNIYSYRIPKYELPAIMNLWGKESVEVGDKVEEPLSFDESDVEIHRLYQKYGEELIKRTYGDDYYSALSRVIEESNEIERDINGSKNPVESENRTSTEVGV